MVSRRRLLFAALPLVAGIAVGATPARAYRVKPVLLVFPAGRDRVAPVGDPKKQEISEGVRMALAARAVQARFEDEGGVDAILFDPETPAVLRALTEARVKLGPAELTEAEKLRIGAAFGAHYIVSVTTRGGTDLIKLDEQVSASNKATEKLFNDLTRGQDGKKPKKVTVKAPVVPAPEGPTLEIEAVEVKRGVAGKRWRDTITLTPDASVTDMAAQKQAYTGALNAAARSLVVRFLSGPLRDVRLATVEKTLQPPPAPPPPTVTVAEVEGTPVDPDAEAAELMRRAEALKADGRGPASVLTLRRAVSMAPRSLAPRMALVRAYLEARQPADAVSEARRALSLLPDIPADRRRELTRMMAQALSDDRDVAGAREIYEQAIKDNPTGVEFRLAYADLLVAQGEVGAAEVQYRVVLRREPGNVEAARGFGRILASRGDFEAALRESASSESPLARFALASVVFIEGANDLAGRVVQNRAAWEDGKLTREALYRATTAQSNHATQLLALLTSSGPPDGVGDAERQAHKRRVLAASLLSQAVTSLVGYLENGEAPAGVKARTLLNEFFLEMKQSQDPPKSGSIPASPNG